MDEEKLKQIVHHFIDRPSEQPHVEFKHNNTDPETMAKNISAIANTLIKNNIPRGYIIWGITDDNHEVVGTTFRPELKKRGNEDIVLWLKKHIKPELEINFYTTIINEKRIVVLVININRTGVSKYDNTPYIRIDKNTRKLGDYPETEKQVWREIVSSELKQCQPCRIYRAMR